MTAAAAPAVGDIVVGFTRLLRRLAIEVPMSATISFADALDALGIDDRDAVYWAGRATLLRRPEDIEVFDRAFAVFFEDRRSDTELDDAVEEIRLTIAVDSDDEEDDDGDAAGDPNDDPTIELRFSAHEVLREKDFAQYNDAELAHAQTLMSQLRLSGATKPSLRMGPTSRRTNRPDIRRTVRAALRAGGEPIERHFSEHTERRRRLVLLLDVSGSMEPYARALLRFVHAAVAGRQKVEAFALGTRLTRVTRELRTRDPDLALAAASKRVVDWSGGTRLGDGLRHFNDEWGVRGMARGAIVVVLSDGWDRGDPEVLGAQMERLHRVAFRVVWVNPLKVTPGYAPLARGMAAALPHVDNFVEGHSLDALEQLAQVIATPSVCRK